MLNVVEYLGVPMGIRYQAPGYNQGDGYYRGNCGDLDVDTSGILPYSNNYELPLEGYFRSPRGVYSSP